MNLPTTDNRPYALPYQALLEVSESIIQHGDLAKLFHDLARRLRPIIRFDFISVMLHDDDKDVMRLHILESERPQQVHEGPDTVPAESPGGLVWQTQQSLLIGDYEQETRFPAMMPIWRGFGMRSGYYLPLTTAQRRLGTINFASAAPRGYDPADLELFQQVARLAAMAVDNALNFEKAECYQRKLAEERDRLRMLLEVNNAVVAHLELRELFLSISACLRRVVPMTYASLWPFTTRSGASSASTRSTSPAARVCFRKSLSSPSTTRPQLWRSRCAGRPCWRAPIWKNSIPTLPACYWPRASAPTAPPRLSQAAGRSAH